MLVALFSIRAPPYGPHAPYGGPPADAHYRPASPEDGAAHGSAHDHHTRDAYAHSAEEAKSLDASDGKMDGQYFGKPIRFEEPLGRPDYRVPKHQRQPKPSGAHPHAGPGHDPYGYDFPRLEEVREHERSHSPHSPHGSHGHSHSHSHGHDDYRHERSRSYERNGGYGSPRRGGYDADYYDDGFFGRFEGPPYSSSGLSYLGNSGFSPLSYSGVANPAGLSSSGYSGMGSNYGLPFLQYPGGAAGYPGGYSGFTSYTGASFSRPL